MATAKQIAARKEFARIMKSGGFGAKRKKNPHPGADRNMGSQFEDNSAIKRKRNPSPGADRSGTQYENNPSKRTPAAKRTINPAKREPSFPYRVDIKTSLDGLWVKHAQFTDVYVAKNFAREYAAKHPDLYVRVIQ